MTHTDRPTDLPNTTTAAKCSARTPEPQQPPNQQQQSSLEPTSELQQANNHADTTRLPLASVLLEPLLLSPWLLPAPVLPVPLLLHLAQSPPCAVTVKSARPVIQKLLSHHSLEMRGGIETYSATTNTHTPTECRTLG